MRICKECYKYAIGTLHTPKIMQLAHYSPSKRLSALPIPTQLDGLNQSTLDNATLSLHQSTEFSLYTSVLVILNLCILKQGIPKKVTNRMRAWQSQDQQGEEDVKS